jgi:hypothetical protein
LLSAPKANILPTTLASYQRCGMITLVLSDASQTTVTGVLNVAININDYLTNYETHRRKETEIAIARHKEMIANTFLAYALLNGEGFKTGPLERWRLDWSEPFKVEDVKEFTKVHQALGGLENYTLEPHGDGRTREVKVVLKPKDRQFSHLRFWYIKKLPKPDKRKGKAGNPKCRLVTRVRKETVLVCDNSRD